MGEQQLFWEDFEVGMVSESPGRTVSESDIMTFAGLSGDYMPIHTDAEFAKHTLFGERIAHGILGLSMASGLFTRTDLARGIQGTVIALLGLEWKFTGPIKIGDTIHVRVTVTDKKETKRAERGIIVLERDVINQRGEVVQRGETPLMIKRRYGR